MSRSQPRFWGPKRHSASQQDARIGEKFPQFTYRRRGARVAWVGTLEPFPGSVYTIRIEYGEAGAPAVFLVNPKVRDDCPHIYPDGRLCLYWPHDRQNPGWQEDSWIANTIIPWSIVWVRYYELWLETGEWLGPEKSHVGTKKG